MAKNSSLLESIADPANGTAKLDNAVVVLSDSFIQFAQAVQDQAINANRTYSIVTTIYTLVDTINKNQLSPSLNTPENQDLLDTIKDNLQNLPILYHMRLMNQFLARYYGQVISDTTEGMDEDCLTLSDQLMQASQDFKDEVSVVPSPFEIIYLLADYYLSARTMMKEDLRLGQIYLVDYEREKLFLTDYMRRFTREYRKEIEQDFIGKCKMQ